MNATNSARQKDIDWQQVRHVYEHSSIGLGDCARQLGCSKAIVARRYYRERWRKAEGVRHNERTTLHNIREAEFRAVFGSLDLPDLTLDYPLPEYPTV
jgi:hypothetical protein